MHSRGIKRKLCGGSGVAAATAAGYVADCEDRRAPPPPYGVQRRALLDMSLVKLQHCHTLAEPDLCRSVLIANTVRQIQEEMMMMMMMHNVDHDGSCQVVPDPFMVSCGPESPPQPLPDSHVSCQSGNASSQSGNVSSQSGNTSCQNSNMLCPNNSDMLCPNEGASCRPRAADHNLATYDLCPEEEEESYCWGRAELKMMGHALLEEEEAESTAMRPPRCILGQEEEELEDDVFLGKLEMRTGASAAPSAGGGGSSPGGLEEFLSDVEASYYDLDTMAIGTATPTTTLTELDHIMEIIVGGS